MRAAGFVFIFFKIFAVFFSRIGTRVVFGGIRGETVRFVVLFFFGSGVLYGLFETQIGNVVISVGDVAGVIGNAQFRRHFQHIYGNHRTRAVCGGGFGTDFRNLLECFRVIIVFVA